MLRASVCLAGMTKVTRLLCGRFSSRDGVLQRTVAGAWSRSLRRWHTCRLPSRRLIPTTSSSRKTDGRVFGASRPRRGPTDRLHLPRRIVRLARCAGQRASQTLHAYSIRIESRGWCAYSHSIRVTCLVCVFLVNPSHVVGDIPSQSESRGWCAYSHSIRVAWLCAY